MIRFYTLILTISFIFGVQAIVFTAHAQESQSFGLAMHGEPKYSATNTHLSYINPDAPKGGALKVAAIGTFDTLNPYSIKGQAPENMNLVYDRLMQRVWDEPFTLYPLIAERIDVAEDRSSITFYLNPKAKFHNGAPITAEDVQYSFEILRDFGRPNMRKIYKLINKADVIDKNTIRFEFGEGYDRETVMIVAMMPVLSKSWWSAHIFDSTLTEIPLLNGPYRIKSSETGHKIIYEGVADYWAKDLLVNKGQYNFDTITYDYYRDDIIALEAFKKGDLNLRREWNIAKWQTAYDGMSAEQIRVEIPHNRPERAHGFIFNLRRPPFDDYNVRKALSLAFDDGWVAQNLFHNEFKRITSFFPNSVLNGSTKLLEAESIALAPWKNDIRPSVFDDVEVTSPSMRERLKEADILLKNAGWIIENGKRVHAETKAPLNFKIIVSTAQEEKIALTYQKSLIRLGIDMQIRMLDSATFQDRKNTYDYDMISFYWQNSLSPGTEQMLYWSCKAAQEPARFNYSGICNPALDHFSEAIANAQSYDVLMQNAHIIDRILTSEYISIPLFYKGVDYIAHNKSIHAPDNTPLYGAVLESWWMDAISK